MSDQPGPWTRSSIHSRWGADPADLGEVHPSFVVEMDTLCFQQLALQRATGATAARAYLAQSVDHTLPRDIAVERQRGQSITDHTRRAASHDGSDLAIRSHFAVRDLAHYGINTFIERGVLRHDTDHILKETFAREHLAPHALQGQTKGWLGL